MLLKVSCSSSESHCRTQRPTRLEHPRKYLLASTMRTDLIRPHVAVTVAQCAHHLFGAKESDVALNAKLM